MSKIATLLGCVLVLTCTMAMAQKRPARSRTPSPGDNCAGPVTIKGKTGPQTCKAGSSGSNTSSPSTVAANAAVLGRIANQKLGKAMPRPGTPDFVPASTTVSGNQLP
jgi:hypothetical protein